MSKNSPKVEPYIEEDHRIALRFLANKVSIVRILLSWIPAVLLFVVPDDDLRGRAAVLVLAVALGLSDAIDGFLARSRNERSRLGMFLDPLGDKLLVFFAIIAIALKYSTTSAGLLLAVTWWVMCAREFILTAQIRIAQRGKVVPPTMLGKVKTAVQMGALACWFLPIPESWVVRIGWVVTLVALVFTLWSWWQYYDKYVASTYPQRRRHPW